MKKPLNSYNRNILVPSWCVKNNIARIGHFVTRSSTIIHSKHIKRLKFLTNPFLSGRCLCVDQELHFLFSNFSASTSKVLLTWLSKFLCYYILMIAIVAIFHFPKIVGWKQQYLHSITKLVEFTSKLFSFQAFLEWKIFLVNCGSQFSSFENEVCLGAFTLCLWLSQLTVNCWYNWEFTTRYA